MPRQPGAAHARFQTHGFWPSRSTLLESLLPASSLARTTKYQAWSEDSGGVVKEVAPAALVYVGIEKFSPDLVSWNGSGFDLPVLNYRGLLAGVQAPRYWETGDADAAFRYNNYLSRFHWRHLDLMDVLAAYQSRARVSLGNVACLLGLPGKLGFSGAQVWEAYLAGNLAGIRHYCETDVLNTYLIYLRFELMRGHFTRERYAEEIERVKTMLRAAPEPHLAEFLRAWESPA